MAARLARMRSRSCPTESDVTTAALDEVGASVSHIAA
jgi:hypothetical protein